MEVEDAKWGDQAITCTMYQQLSDIRASHSGTSLPLFRVRACTGMGMGMGWSLTATWDSSTVGLYAVPPESIQKVPRLTATHTLLAQNTAALGACRPKRSGLWPPKTSLGLAYGLFSCHYGHFPSPACRFVPFRPKLRSRKCWHKQLQSLFPGDANSREYR